MTRFILKFLLISKMPKAIFKEVRIKSEDRVGQTLRQDRPSEKTWLTAINGMRRPRQDTPRMQRVSIESETKIKIWGKTGPQPDYGGSKFKKYLYLDEFRYSGIYEIADYESREVRVQIRIRNRQKSPKGPQGFTDRPIVRLIKWLRIMKLCTRIDE